MRYSLKFLQRAGLVSTMLIGGVLGGLTAPLPSDAGTPTLTLQIDSLPLTTSTGTVVPNNSILGAKLSACSSADQGLGYTDCYAIVTSNTTAYEGKKADDGTRRYWRVQVAPNQTARLRIGDNVGQDYASIIGVAFVPVTTATQAVTAVTDWGNVSSSYANTLEEHKLTIKSTNNFDSSVNVNNATGVVKPGPPPITVGKVAHALRSGGEFDAGPLHPVNKLCVATTTTTDGVITVNAPVTTAKCDAVNNIVSFTGVGKFNTATENILSPAGSANNSQALGLSIKAGSKELPKVNWPGNTNATLGQVDTPAPGYPKFDCILSADILSADHTKCKPIMTWTMTATTKGPDTLLVVGGPDHFSANCTTEAIKGFNQAIIFLASVVATADRWEQAHHNPRFRAIINDAKAFLATFNTPTDPTCPGANVVRLKMFIAALQDQFVYTANGSVQADIGPAPPTTGTITIFKSVPSSSSAVFTFSITGPSLWNGTISMGGMNSNSTVVTVNAGTYYVLEQAEDEWQLTSSNCGSEVGSGSPVPVVVPSGGNVTCTFNNSPVVTPTGTITITKRVPCLDCVSDPTIFNFIIDGGVTMAIVNLPIDICCFGGGTDVSRDQTVNGGVFPLGTYAVREDPLSLYPNTNWVSDTVTCSDGSGVVVYDGVGPLAGIHVSPGAHITCIFTNHEVG